MTTTLERLSAILVRDYKLDPAKVTADAPLESLGIDSLGVAELLFNIEDEFGITLPAEPVVLPTVGDVVRFIDELVAARPVPTELSATSTTPAPPSTRAPPMP